MNTPREIHYETEKKATGRLIGELACGNYFGEEELHIFLANLSEDAIKCGRNQGTLSILLIIDGCKTRNENET
jgi:hypothetical protein